ncbi:MAG: ABC transporter substrate-binding protein [Aeromicrobium sp.]|uniref:ABC transporter substrate-binding protein n=1 Tax=Aeromicrobium sp. TaxID=1871063 RepID=UPI0039E2C574
MSHVRNPVSRARRTRAIIGALAASMLLLAVGCGTAGDDSDTATRTVTDGSGKVTIPAKPTRVVAADASTYAQLVSLGIEPIAAVLPEGVPTEYFKPDGVQVPNIVAEDGWTVSLDKALDLDADLIVTQQADWNQENIDRYKKSPIPTYALDEGWKDIDDVYTKYREFAKDMGRSDEAETTIDEFEKKLQDGKAELAPYVEQLGTVGIIRVTDEPWVGARVEDVVATALLPGLGLKVPEWPAANADGYFQVELETLEQLDVPDTFFVETDTDPSKLSILESDVWKSLTPVENHKVIMFTAKWWNGDLLQLGAIVDEIVDNVTKSVDAS